MGILISAALFKGSRFVVGDELSITTRIGENSGFGEGDTCVYSRGSIILMLLFASVTVLSIASTR